MSTPSLRSRLFSPPTLHTPKRGHERRVGWLELFYDLVFVATFIQLGNELAKQVTPLGYLSFAGLMVPVWLTWTGFTFFTNRFVVDDVPHRALVLLQMLVIAGVAVTIPSVFRGEHVPFAVAYTMARLLLVSFYVRAYKYLPLARPLTRRFAGGFALGAAVMAASIVVPAPWTYLCWATAIFIEFATPLGRSARSLIARYPPDSVHISERYGLLTLIVLGESFVKVVSALGDAQLESHAAPLVQVVGFAAGGLVITAALWWLYFDDIAGSKVKMGPLRGVTWVYAHLPLSIGLVGLGVAVKKVAFFDPAGVAPAAYRWLLSGSLALALLANAALCMVTERRHSQIADRARLVQRVGAAILVLLVAPAGKLMPSWGFLTLTALICVAQIMFDLSVAPMAEATPEHHEPAGFGLEEAEATQATQAGAVDPTRRGLIGIAARAAVDNTVRLGAPADLRGDLYFHLMRGGWVRLVSTLGGTFLFLNLLFAALYALEPGSVGNTDHGSFTDLFFFSVQTIATIGYGGMSPNTLYGNTLMVLEAVVGILFTALATGLMFAKASRPQASVVFSQPILISSYFGKPTLMFRAGNARGNEIVEASVTVSLVVDRATPEGTNMRELTDLTLRRNRQPLFAFSWTVMHTIDETSPLYGVTAQNLHERVGGFIVSMAGHDSTYGSTTHARHYYDAHDMRIGYRFRDMNSYTPDGRQILDYGKIHLVDAEVSTVEGHTHGPGPAETR